MRHSIVILAFFVCIGFAHSGDDARAIVDKSITAAGGEANLKKFMSMTWKEKGTFYGFGEGLPYTGKHAIAYPDKFRMEIVDVFVMVVNGDKGWMSGMGKNEELSKEHLATQRSDNRAGWITSLIPLKDKAFTLKSLPEAKVGDVPTSVVEVSRKDYPTVKLFFDKKSNLLIRSQYQSKAADMNFKEVAMEMNFSDFREVGGAKHPHKVVMNRDGKKYVEAEMMDIVASPTIDPKLFARPE